MTVRVYAAFFSANVLKSRGVVVWRSITPLSSGGVDYLLDGMLRGLIDLLHLWE